jgi:hypothetical protein
MYQAAQEWDGTHAVHRLEPKKSAAAAPQNS